MKFAGFPFEDDLHVVGRMIHWVLLRLHPPCSSAEFDQRIVATLREECATFFGVMDDFANCVFGCEFVEHNVTRSNCEKNGMSLFEKFFGNGPMILLDLFNDRLETFHGFRFVVFDFHHFCIAVVHVRCRNFACLLDVVDHCLFLLFVVDEHLADVFKLVEAFLQRLFGFQKFAVLRQDGCRMNETRVRCLTHGAIEIARSEKCGG